MKRQHVPGKPGRALKRAREDAGFTQAELAARLDCDRMTVSRVERNAQHVSVELADRWRWMCGKDGSE